MYFFNIHTSKSNKYTNYLLIVLIMYGSFYMFRHYIANFREHS
jgi:TRAP-type C4-dicarboxylate transport system permease small subunit